MPKLKWLLLGDFSLFFMTQMFPARVYDFPQGELQHYGSQISR